MMTETLQSLYALFGNAVFLVLEFGTKELRLPKWAAITFADSQKSNYQKKLQERLAAGGNIACRCGPPSDNLISIDIDDDARLSEFLSLNPWSVNTLVTKGKKGANVWFRSPNPNYPNGQAYYRLLTNSGQAYGEFRCGGTGGAYTVIFGRHPEKVDYQILQRKPASILDVNQINWPPDVILPWASQSAGPTTAPPPTNPFPAVNERPCFRCYDAPIVIGNNHYQEGVYYHFIQEDKDANGNVVELAIDQWILSVVRVLCIVRTDFGTGHAYLLEYVPHGETQPRRAVLSQAGLLGRGEEALKELRDLGVSVLGCNAKLVRAYLDSQHLKFSHRKTPNDFWTSVKVIGWAPVGTRFVLPYEIIGSQRGVWFSGKTDLAHYRKGGDFDLWKKEVAAPCEDNSYLILALSCALAGPLLEPLNIPGLGIHYFGDSTTGKSTSLAAAASVWGPDKFMISWRTTLNGLEIQAASRSSTLIPVDESHQVDPKALDASVYMLLNGTAKARMNKDTSPREIEHWRACVLSSGERSIETHQTNAKIDHKVGQTVRIIDVPVLNSQYGLFENIHSAANGAEFADALRDSARQHYGYAGPAFVAKAITHYAGLSLSTRLANILPSLGQNLSAQDARVARSFALCALAGELAIEWGILPWQPRSALFAAANIFKFWQSTQPNSLRSKEAAQLLTGFSGFIETRDADFSDADWTPQFDQYGRITNAEPLIYERAGYWKEINGNRIYCFTAEGFTRASSGFGARKAAEILDAAGALVDKDAGKRTKKIWIPRLKRSLSFYMVDPEKLEVGP